MEERGEASSATSDTLSWDDSLMMPGSIFLSHSGRQKLFVSKLYRALLRANYRPFFDLDTKVSLPPGLDYPPRILQACQACKVAIIVLSKDYITSLWPMLELQHLLHPASSASHIYPLFYDLKPGDLANPTNLAHWKEYWDNKATKWHDRMLQLQEVMSASGCGIQINLDMSLWPKNLQQLQYKSGEVRWKLIHVNSEETLHQQTEDCYIQAIVSNIRSAVRPQPLSLDKGIEGGKRMHEEIAKVFEKEESLGADGVCAVGVHGIGGSGKSTLCKMMATFYSNHFDGKCYYLEFPSNDNEADKFLRNIKAILPALTLHSASIVEASKIDQAMDLLKEGLQISKVFLAMDNVWDRSIDYAERTLLMKFMPGSKILVTSRKKKVLTDLLQSRLERLESNMPAGSNMMNRDRTQAHPMVVHVPSLNELEAVDALKFYSGSSRRFIPDEDEWRSLARSCFFAGQCHPLYLKLKGVEIKTKGREWFSDEQWKHLILSLKSDLRHAPNPSGGSIEKEVERAVEKSFNELHLDLQNIFIDLATAWRLLNGLTSRQGGGIELWDVLCYFSDNDYTANDMFYQVLELEYHGLLEVKVVDDGDGYFHETLEIHDLHRMFARSRVSRDPGSRHANALINHVLEGDLSEVSSFEIASKKYVRGHGLQATLLGSRKRLRTLLKWITTADAVQTRTDPVQAQIRVLCLSEYISGPAIFSSINLQGGLNMKALRVLQLSQIKGIGNIDGWEGIPNLVQLSLFKLHDLRRIGGLGGLKRLETLHIQGCENLEVQVLVGDHWKKSLVKVGDHLPKLQVLCFDANLHLAEVGSTFCNVFPALKWLRLSSCDRLERLPNLRLGSLRTLELAFCDKLKSISEGGICSLPALQYLILSDCEALERLPDLSTLVDLQRLDALGCVSLLEARLNLTISACKHLKWLSLHGLNCRANDHGLRGTSIVSLLADAVLCVNDRFQLLSSGSRDTVLMNPFSNLQILHLQSCVNMTAKITSGWLDVGGLPSLEKLTLQSFDWVQNLSIISLVNLETLELKAFSILEGISGLGVHHERLSSIVISECPLLESIPALPVSLGSFSLWRCAACKFVSNLAALTCLTELFISYCPALADVSSVAGLTSLETLSLEACTSLREIPDLKHFPALQCLAIWYPGPCWTLSEAAVQQMVRKEVFLHYQP